MSNSRHHFAHEVWRLLFLDFKAFGGLVGWRSCVGVVFVAGLGDAADNEFAT